MLFKSFYQVVTDDHDIPRVRPAIAAGIFNKRHFVALLGIVAVIRDLADMTKNVMELVDGNEANPFIGVSPLYGTD
jgi:hypothetical protein